MRKILFFTSIIFFTTLILPAVIKAECYYPNITGGIHCPRGLFGCLDTNGYYWCCSVRDECKLPSFISPVPNPSPPPGLPPGPIGRGDIHGSCGEYAITTALGCIPVKDTIAFTKWLLGWGVGIAGGIAILLMIAGALMVIVSSGDPNKVKAGSELITSALAGLLFIIFSLFLLRLIGIEILQIPGL